MENNLNNINEPIYKNGREVVLEVDNMRINSVKVTLKENVNIEED